MKILTRWLRDYLPTLPAAVDDRQLADDLTLRGIAVEGVHDLGTHDLGHPNGSLFEMDITTNRVDAMNHYGIAREAATIYNIPLAPLHPTLALEPVVPSNPNPAPPPAPTPIPHFQVRIDAPELCGRFTARILRNVMIAPSTGRICDYFSLLGQKAISNAVDASNFTLLGMGHPTHAFDLDKIHGGITIRLAHAGEKLRLLDGSERTLTDDDLVIADDVKPLSLAGVMGGWDSMITPETRNVLVESAWFDPAAIRRSSRRHLLHTDASHRFERGADFNAAPLANDLVSSLILEHGGHADSPLFDVVIPAAHARTAARPPITLSVAQVHRHLGATLADTLADTIADTPDGLVTQSALTPNLIHQYLTALGCTLNPTIDTADPGRAAAADPGAGLNPATPAPVGAAADPGAGLHPATPAPVGAGGFSPLNTTSHNKGFSPGDQPTTNPTTFSVVLPSWRLDLEREIDLIEEVARVYGYNRFANTLPTPGIVIAHPSAAAEAAVRSRLLSLGYSESISSTFASHADSDLFSAPGHAAIPMENPLSEEASMLRPSLVPGMLTMLSNNLNRDVRDVRLFEQGQIFTGKLHDVPENRLAHSSENRVQHPSENRVPHLSGGPIAAKVGEAPPKSGEAPPTPIEEVTESAQLTLGLTGAFPEAKPYLPADAPFFELKGVIESLCGLFTLPGGPAALTFTPNAPAWLQPGRSATALLNNQPIAHFGELSTAESIRRKLRQPVFLAQFDLARLYDLPLKRVTARDLSRFQAVERDFSFIFPDAVQWHAIAAGLDALSIPELTRLTPVEVWRNPKKFPGVYSLLIRTVFQSPDRTLRDEDLTAWSSRIIDTLTSLGGTLRGE